MNRRQAILGPMSFFAGAAANSATGILPGSCKKGGNLNGLQHKGKPAGSILAEKILVVYFTTAHKVPSCSSDLKDVESAVKDMNAKLDKNAVLAVAIYPEPDRADRFNLTEYIDKPGSTLVGLTGPKGQILELARQYASFYMPDLNGHTRLVSVMDVQGRNVAMVHAAEIPHATRKLVERLQRDELLPADCRP